MSKADNIYLNIPIPSKPDTSDNPYPHNKRAIYDETLSVPVIQNPSDYYASIIRFSLPVSEIPLFLFPLNIHQPDPDISNLMIGIITSPGNVMYQQFVRYIVNSNTSNPPTPSGSDPYFTYDDTISSYYYIFYIQPFINMVNTALAAAVTASGIGVTAPYYIYTPTTQLLSLIVTQAFLATGAKIFMNSLLLPYFNSFNFDVQHVPGSLTQSIAVHNLSTIPYGSPVGGPYQFIEEYNSINLWPDIRKIVITTSLPINQEANPINLGNVNGSAAYLPIFTDFVVAYNNISDISSVITYNPQSQYRLVDMSSNTPINRISLTFYWLSKNGSLLPVYISPNQSITVKIGFFKKDLYKNSNLTKIM